MGVSMGALGSYALHRPDPGLWAIVGMAALVGGTMQVPLTAVIFVLELTGDFAALPGLLIGSIAAAGVTVRSEEHTSELQSQSNLVCRLLLEKKKTRATN